MKKRTLTLLLALVLLLGVVVGSTLAWLLDASGPVQNIFTTSDINIELTETTDEDTATDGRQFKMIPGHTNAKDPKVTVKAGSEKCYVFVELEKSTNYNDYLKDYTLAGDWKLLKENMKDSTGIHVAAAVYYREVDGTDADQEFYVLAGKTGFDHGYVTVKEGVTKAMMNSLTETTYPTLTITAYACQYYKSNGTEFSPEDAWEQAKPAAPLTPAP